MKAVLASSSLEDLWFGGGADDTARQGASASVAALMARIHGVKPLPVAAHRLMQATRNPDTPVATIARLLETDAGLLARVLRLVNSAVFGLRSPCTSARAAITLLGPRRIAEVATASAILDTFDDGTDAARAVFEHALAVAAIMKRVAHRCELSTDDAFACGLLHDIGELMQLQVGDIHYGELLTECAHDHDHMAAREREVYGFDHGVLAGHMLQEWKIPEPVPEAVTLHHHAARAYEIGGDVADMVHLLRLAEHLEQTVKGPRPDDDTLDAVAKNESLVYLELSRDDLISLWKDLHEAIAHSRRVLSGGEGADPAPTADERASGIRQAPPIPPVPRAASAVAPPRHRPRSLRRTLVVAAVSAAVAIAAVSALTALLAQ
jgi:putative nucleotidyltransferase with HDIG domain